MQVIHTDLAPAAIGTYSQAIQSGRLVFLSGQIPLHPETMTLVGAEIEHQIEQVFKNLSAVCEAAGGGLNDIVKLQVYLMDLSVFSLVNEKMADFFSVPYPARAVIQVSGLPKGALIEVDGIMICP